MKMSTGQFPFDYSAPLTGRNIRLLKFQKCSRSENTPRKCVQLELIEASLPDKGSGTNGTPDRYMALSYFWVQSDDNNPEILINEKPFKVTPNLEKALVYLEPEVDLPIWIDAVCINQNDLTEKAGQVAQMTDIYQCAVRTIIWLGEGDDSTNQVMTHLDKIGQDAIAAGLEHFDPEDLKKWPNFGSDEAKIQIKTRLEALFPKMSSGYEDRVPFPLQSLIKISELPWFKRVWIVQELSVSSDYTFMCGKWSVPGDHFVAGFLFSLIWTGDELRKLTQGGSIFRLPFRLFSMWWRNGWQLGKGFLGIFTGKPVTVNARAASTLGTRRKWIRDRPTLKQQLCHAFILSAAHGLDARNPRDRIYAFLGIASDAQELNIDPVDYGKKTSALYTEVAKKLLQRGHLDILSLCRAPTSGKPRDVALPSWAPDWEKRISPPWGGFIEKNIEDGINDNIKNTLYYASGSDQPEWIPTCSENVIAFKARFLGKLKETGTTWNSGWDDGFHYDKVRTLFDEVIAFLGSSSIYSHPGERGNVFWRIPIGDKEVGALGMTQRATIKSLEECQILVDILTNKHSPFKIPKMDSYLSSMKDMHNAKPFLSEDAFGGYVGLCPHDSELGDEIFIPLGSHVPFVFRKADEGFFKVVGEAYVQGLMDGEALGLELECREVRLI